MSDENRVAVIDVDMPFGSMVRFMVKWAIASIPALLILTFLTAVFWVSLIGVAASIGSAFTGRPSTSTAAPKASSVTTKSPASDDSAYVPNIELRNVQVGTSTLGEVGAFGEVKNNGERTVKTVEITVYCLG